MSWVPETPASPPSIDAFCGFELVRSVHEMECVRPYAQDFHRIESPAASGPRHAYSSSSSIRSSKAASPDPTTQYAPSAAAQAAADVAAAEAADQIAAEARSAYMSMSGQLPPNRAGSYDGGGGDGRPSLHPPPHAVAHALASAPRPAGPRPGASVGRGLGAHSFPPRAPGSSSSSARGSCGRGAAGRRSPSPGGSSSYAEHGPNGERPSPFHPPSGMQSPTREELSSHAANGYGSGAVGNGQCSATDYDAPLSETGSLLSWGAPAPHYMHYSPDPIRVPDPMSSNAPSAPQSVPRSAQDSPAGPQVTLPRLHPAISHDLPTISLRSPTSSHDPPARLTRAPTASYPQVMLMPHLYRHRSEEMRGREQRRRGHTMALSSAHGADVSSCYAIGDGGYVHANHARARPCTPTHPTPTHPVPTPSRAPQRSDRPPRHLASPPHPPPRAPRGRYMHAAHPPTPLSAPHSVERPVTTPHSAGSTGRKHARQRSFALSASSSSSLLERAYGRGVLRGPPAPAGFVGSGAADPASAAAAAAATAAAVLAAETAAHARAVSPTPDDPAARSAAFATSPRPRVMYDEVEPPRPDSMVVGMLTGDGLNDSFRASSSVPDLFQAVRAVQYASVAVEDVERRERHRRVAGRALRRWVDACTFIVRHEALNLRMDVRTCASKRRTLASSPRSCAITLLAAHSPRAHARAPLLCRPHTRLEPLPFAIAPPPLVYPFRCRRRRKQTATYSNVVGSRPSAGPLWIDIPRRDVHPLAQQGRDPPRGHPPPARSRPCLPGVSCRRDLARVRWATRPWYATRDRPRD